MPMSAEQCYVNRVENGWVITVMVAGSNLLLIAKTIDESHGLSQGHRVDDAASALRRHAGAAAVRRRDDAGERSALGAGALRMTPRRAPPSARSTPPRSAGAHPNARAVYEHVERYLVGACNQEALEAWQLAVGTGLAAGLPLDEILRQMAHQWAAGALGVTPAGRDEPARPTVGGAA